LIFRPKTGKASRIAAMAYPGRLCDRSVRCTPGRVRAVRCPGWSMRGPPESLPPIAPARQNVRRPAHRRLIPVRVVAQRPTKGGRGPRRRAACQKFCRLRRGGLPHPFLRRRPASPPAVCIVRAIGRGDADRNARVRVALVARIPAALDAVGHHAAQVRRWPPPPSRQDTCKSCIPLRPLRAWCTSL
jgi:hypothetical protein